MLQFLRVIAAWVCAAALAGCASTMPPSFEAADIPIFKEDLETIEMGAPFLVPVAYLAASDEGVPPIVSRTAVNQHYDTLIVVRVAAKFVGSEGIAFRHFALGERDGLIVWKDPNIPERMLCLARHRGWDAVARCPR